MFNNKVDYVVGLDRLLRSGTSNERVIEWYNLSGHRYSNTAIKATLRQAGREDLTSSLIKEEDIELGETVKSRMTSRTGKVVKIHADGDTISVKWETGGVQALPKESVFVVDAAGNIKNKVTTTADGYAGTDLEKIYSK